MYFLATLDFLLRTNAFFCIIRTIYCLLLSILLTVFNDHVNIINLLSTMNQGFFLDKCGKSTLLKKRLGCLRLCHCLHYRNHRKREKVRACITCRAVNNQFLMTLMSVYYRAALTRGRYLCQS